MSICQLAANGLRDLLLDLVASARLLSSCTVVPLPLAMRAARGQSGSAREHLTELTSFNTITSRRAKGVARSAFVDGTIDILRIAAGLVALGLLASALLVRRTDLHQEQDGARPVAAA